MSLYCCLQSKQSCGWKHFRCFYLQKYHNSKVKKINRFAYIVIGFTFVLCKHRGTYKYTITFFIIFIYCTRHYLCYHWLYVYIVFYWYSVKCRWQKRMKINIRQQLIQLYRSSLILGANGTIIVDLRGGYSFRSMAEVTYVVVLLFTIQTIMWLKTL
jgi:hypothetical protein